MARPRRPQCERAAVRAAAKALPCDLSNARKAQEVARQVTAAFIADHARTDPFERALAHAEYVLGPDPITAIVIADDSVVVAKFMRERLARFEARGCTQIGKLEWEGETQAIARTVQGQLARRFRDYLR